MTTPTLQNKAPVRVYSGPGITALCAYFGYAIWHTMDLRRINKKQTKIYKEYVRRAEAIYEGHKKLQGLIAAEYGGEDGGST